MGGYDYLCDVEVDYCYSNPCNNTGVCERTEGGYTCKCKDGFAGKIPIQIPEDLHNKEVYLMIILGQFSHFLHKK